MSRPGEWSASPRIWPYGGPASGNTKPRQYHLDRGGGDRRTRPAKRPRSRRTTTESRVESESGSSWPSALHAVIQRGVTSLPRGVDILVKRDLRIGPNRMVKFGQNQILP